MIANSTHTQAMIKRYYRRDSTVIFPPVETDRFKLRSKEAAIAAWFRGSRPPDALQAL